MAIRIGMDTKTRERYLREFDTVYAEEEKLVLLFRVPWCKSCCWARLHFEARYRDVEGFRFVTVDLSKTGNDVKVTKYPTFVVFNRRNKTVDVLEGATAEHFRALDRSLLERSESVREVRDRAEMATRASVTA